MPEVAEHARLLEELCADAVDERLFLPVQRLDMACRRVAPAELADKELFQGHVAPQENVLGLVGAAEAAAAQEAGYAVCVAVEQGFPGRVCLPYYKFFAKIGKNSHSA